MATKRGTSRTGLRARLAQLPQEISDARENVNAAQKRLSVLEKEQVAITQRLNDKPDGIQVSDHAVLRYIERHHGFDVEAIRSEILTPDRMAAIKAGASSISAGGLSFKVQNGVITTVQ